MFLEGDFFLKCSLIVFLLFLFACFHKYSILFYILGCIFKFSGYPVSIEYTLLGAPVYLSKQI